MYNFSTNWKVNIWPSQKINNMLPSPTAQDIQICETTERYLCPMNQALYAVDKIEWCVYALYKQDTERIGTYCTIVTTFRHANMA